MEGIRRHLSFANVASALALFISRGGGTAVALNGSNTVQSDDLGPGAQVKAPDVAANAVNGSKVVDASLSLADLNATSRPHKLEFNVPSSPPTIDSSIAEVGQLRVRGDCFENPSETLNLKLTNLSTSTGTLSALLTSQSASDGPVALHTVGQSVNAATTVTVDHSDAGPAGALASGSFNRVEGQIVFRTPGRVTTIDFHAFTGAGRCEFYGTAVTSSLS